MDIQWNKVRYGLPQFQWNWVKFLNQRYLEHQRQALLNVQRPLDGKTVSDCGLSFTLRKWPITMLALHTNSKGYSSEMGLFRIR